MRRHWSERVGAIVLALWFVVVGVAPGAIGTCPMHMAVAATAHAAHGASHAGHTMASGNVGTAAAGDQHSAPDPHHSHNCTCPGSCCSAAALAALGAQPSLAQFTEFTEAPSAFERSVPREWTDFVLPFRTPPPQATSA